MCFICPLEHKEFNATLDTIQKHYRTIRHANAEFVNYGEDPHNNENAALRRKAWIGEIKLSAVFAEHSLPFKLANHLTPVCKQISDDTDAREVWRRIILDRFKVKSVIQDVIAETQQDELIEAITENKFGIQFDQATDRSQINKGVLIIKYPDFNRRKMQSFMWEMFDTLDLYKDNNQTSAERLYTKIRNSFEEKNVDLRNASSFVADGCPTMMGPYTSVAARFSNDVPNLIIVKCPAHSIHLCAKVSMNELPPDILRFITNLSSYFHYSYKKTHRLRTHQVYLNADINKILTPSTTQWLAIEGCVKRVLEQYDVLFAYFTEATAQRIPNARELLNAFTSINKIYLNFLYFILHEVNKVNKFLRLLY